MENIDPMTCTIADLAQLAENYGVARHMNGTGRLVVDPYDGPRPDIHAACVARHDEVRTELIRTRYAPFDPERAANDAAWRVCQMPYEALCNLAIYSLHFWLARADAGMLDYQPPFPPRWDDDLPVPDDTGDSAREVAKPTPPTTNRPSGRFSLRDGGRRD